MSKNIIIFGSSDHAKVVIDVIEKQGEYVIAGLIDKFKKKGDDIMGYKIIGSDEDLPRIVQEQDICGGIIGIGDNWRRLKISEYIAGLAPDFRFVTAIHPSAQVGKNVKIGEGTMMMAGSVVNPNSIVGAHCILNTNSSLDHDCHMEDFASLAPNAATGGNVKIGVCTAIGLGASISNKIVIKAHTVIGAGAVVVKDMPEFVVAYGTPAKAMHPREAGEAYM